MLEKIIEISGVGRFVSSKPSGDVSFKKLNLIYSGNGQGKTTLCTIFRSLAFGNSAFINERKTRGYSDSPVVKLRAKNSNLTFSENGWSEIYENISVYDSEFVHENIHSGEVVDHENKKGLYRVLIGQEGIELAKSIDELDEESRSLAKEIAEAKRNIELKMPDGIKFDDFLSLDKSENIDNEIKAKQSEVDALDKLAEIESTDLLTQIVKPTIPDNLFEILSKQLEGLSREAETEIEKHLQNHTKGLSLSWLADGWEGKKGDNCPFCSQSLNGVSLIQQYSTIFSERYNQFKQEISEMDEELSEILRDSAILRSNPIEKNETLAKFWGEFISFDMPEIDFLEAVAQPAKEFFDKAALLLSNKKAAPLEEIDGSSLLKNELRTLQSAINKIESYNGKIKELNALIEQKKSNTKSANVNEEKRILTRLVATRTRFTVEVESLCDHYKELIQEKKNLTRTKSDTKKQLDQYSEKTFGSYGSRINEILGRFGADFTISEIRPSFSGGTPSSSFSVIINNEEISIGDAKTPRGEPSFRSSLSAGDKSSLALAFFIAQLEKNPSKESQIVIFDDPFSSQDRTRREHTQQLICRLIEQVQQVFVTSHDPHFLKLVFDGNFSNESKTLQISRIGKSPGNTISEWDIHNETNNSYLREISEVRNFVFEDTGLASDVVRKIRPLMEKRLRFMFPFQFKESEWLGDMISKIRGADENSPLFQAIPALDEINDLNSYSKKYHHKNDSLIGSEAPDDGELRAFAKRLLEFVGSL